MIFLPRIFSCKLFPPQPWGDVCVPFIFNAYHSSFVHSVIPAPYLIIDTDLNFNADKIFPPLRFYFIIILTRRKYSQVVSFFTCLCLILSFSKTPIYLYASPPSRLFMVFPLVMMIPSVLSIFALFIMKTSNPS